MLCVLWQCLRSIICQFWCFDPCCVSRKMVMHGSSPACTQLFCWFAWKTCMYYLMQSASLHLKEHEQVDAGRHDWKTSVDVPYQLLNMMLHLLTNCAVLMVRVSCLPADIAFLQGISSSRCGKCGTSLDLSTCSRLGKSPKPLCSWALLCLAGLAVGNGLTDPALQVGCAKRLTIIPCILCDFLMAGMAGLRMWCAVASALQNIYVQHR